MTGAPEPAPHDTILPGELSQAEQVVPGEETLRYPVGLGGTQRLLPGELSVADAVPGEETFKGNDAGPTPAPKRAPPAHQTLLPGELSEAASLFDAAPEE